MNKSETIQKISAALVKAQSQMSDAVKGAKNPFFKSTYADLNSIREAVMPALNANGISVIQPTTVIDGIDYVETVLLHESGDYLSSLTRIVVGKQNDAQSHGSGLSYARRYALQSICNVGAHDDDGNAAVAQPPATKKPDPAEPYTRRTNDVELIIDLIDNATNPEWLKMLISTNTAFFNTNPEIKDRLIKKGQSLKNQ